MLSERPMDWTHWLCVITRGLDAVVRGSQLRQVAAGEDVSHEDVAVMDGAESAVAIKRLHTSGRGGSVLRLRDWRSA